MAFLKGNKGEIEVRTEVKVNGDLGKIIPVSFITRWRTFSVSDTRKLRDEAQLPGFDEDAIIRDRLAGWRDLKGEDGSDVPFGEDVVTEMLERHEYRKALVDALLGVAFGIQSVQEKN